MALWPIFLCGAFCENLIVEIDGVNLVLLLNTNFLHPYIKSNMMSICVCVCVQEGRGQWLFINNFFLCSGLTTLGWFI